MLVNLHEDTLRHWTRPGELLRSVGPVGMQGALTKRVLIDTNQKQRICGVLFEPGGQSAFHSERASRFTDTIIDAEQIWGHVTRALRSDLIAEKDTAVQCEIIEKFLVDRLQNRPAEDEKLSAMVAALRSGEQVTALQKRMFTSQRQIHELFDRRIGIRPKLFSRLERFSATLADSAATSNASSPAYDHGYADQAHMTREFREFSGATPTAHAGVAQQVNHAHMEPYEMFNTSKGDRDTL